MLAITGIISVYLSFAPIPKAVAVQFHLVCTWEFRGKMLILSAYLHRLLSLLLELADGWGNRVWGVLGVDGLHKRQCHLPVAQLVHEHSIMGENIDHDGGSV